MGSRLRTAFARWQRSSYSARIMSSEDPPFIPPSPATAPIVLVDSDHNQTTLTISNGDIIASALTGPNAGKTVNLTYGKWV